MPRLFRRAADLFTIGRIALLPFLLHRVAANDWPEALAWIAVLGATDALDGPLARRSRKTARYGQILDVAADFLLVFSTTLILCDRGILPWYIPALMTVSVASFGVTAWRAPKPRRRLIGMYTGGVCLTCLGGIFLARILQSTWAGRVTVAARLVMAGILGLSVLENLIGFLRLTPAVSARPHQKANPLGDDPPPGRSPLVPPAAPPP